MTRLTLGLLTLLLLPLPACDTQPEEPEPRTIVDKTPQEAADLTTEVACDYVARCGIIEVTCADCAEGQDCGGCTTEVIEVSPQECAEDLGPELEQIFGCGELTAEEQALVDECLAALPDAACPSVEVVEDGAEPPEDLSDDLQACEVFEQISERCGIYGQSEPGEPGPDVPPPAEPMPG